MYVCLFSHCPLASLKNYTAELYQFSLHFVCGRDGVAIMSCSTSGFVDDVMFLHNGLMCIP